MHSSTSSIAIIVLVATLVVPGTIGAEAPDEKSRAIMELMDLTGAGAMGAQVAQSLLAQLKPLFPQVPAEFWQELLASINAEEVSALVLPIYSRHFSLEEIRGLLAFYRTPLGAKILEVQPAITGESMRVGQQWGEAKARELLERLSERGYEPVAL